MSPRPRMASSQTDNKTTMKNGSAALSHLAGEHPSYLVWMIVALLLSLGSAVLSILAPSYLSDLTNTLQAGAVSHDIDMGEVTRLGITLALFYLFSALVNFTSAMILGRISNYYARDLRTAIEKKIDRLPLSYFDSKQIGDILSRITNDVDTISQSLTQSISGLLQSIVLLVGVLIAMFVKQWIMAFTVVATLPILLVIIFLMVHFARPQFSLRQKTLGEVNGIAEENYSGMTVIKAFGAEKRMSVPFDEANARLGKAQFKSEAYMGILMPSMNFISYLAYAAVAVVGGLLILDDKASLGTISEFLVYVNLFQSPLNQISQSLNSLSSAGAASERVYEFLGEKEMESEADKPLLLLNQEKPIRGEVEFDDVHFSYPDSEEIIHGFSAKVQPGWKVAIVGPTGAGKTTLVNLLMRFYDVDSGDIKIDGVSTKAMSREELHRVFGMVLQDTWVFEGTLRENLVYNTPNVTDEAIYAALKSTHLLHYVKSMKGGLDYMIADGSSISAGERQLITITRAVLRGAPITILDEATSNVDTRTEERIQKAMDALTKGKTSFVIAHRLSTIKNADLILVLDHGSIVEQGTHESLMEKNGFYASLYNSQFAFE